MLGDNMYEKELLHRIERYFYSDMSPEYAILLHGDWGCGKTFFCNKIIECFSSEFVWYLSLFGVKNKEDIDNKFFEMAHPVLSSQKGKAITKVGLNVINSCVKTKYNINITNVLGDLCDIAKDIEDKIQCKMLIVDDLERAKMSIGEIFGYFSPFLLDGLKIIIVANETEIPEEYKKEYDKYKEKIIGESYELEPNFKEIIISLNNECNIPDINKYNEVICESCGVLGIKNLRLVKQTFYQWKRLADCLEEQFKDDISFIYYFYQIYVVLKVQHKYSPALFTGEQKDELEKRMYFQQICQKAWIAFSAYKMPLNKYKRFLEDGKNEFNKSYLTDKIIYSLPIANSWYDIIVSGREIDDEWIHEQINNAYEQYKMKYKSKEVERNIDYMYRLVIYEHDNTINFEKYFKDMCEEFERGAYLSFRECVQFVQVYLKLISYEALPLEYYSVDKLKQLITKFKEKYHASIHIEGICDTSAKQCPKVTDVQDVQQCVNELFYIAYNNQLSEKNKILHDKDYFYKLIETPINALNDFLNVPILKTIGHDIVFQWLECNRPKHDELYDFLRYRYGFGIEGRELSKIDYQDLASVIEFKEKYEQKYRELRYSYTLELIFYKKMANKYQEIIEYMQEEMVEL